MSTPINTLPLKTQQTNVSDSNDINDPLVQDVLSEFQEELMMSKRPPISQQMSQEQLIQQQQMMLQQQMQQQQMQQLQRQQQQPPPPQHNINKYENMSSYLDIEVAKKSLILVIVSLIIYNSGIINIIYEKLPDYLQDNLNSFDIYIKSVSLFLIIYVLSFFEYI